MAFVGPEPLLKALKPPGAAPPFHGPEPGTESGEPTVRGAFEDEQGALLFQEVEHEGRRWVRRPDGNGGYVNKAEGVRRVLWNLPRLRAHLAEGLHAGPAYLTEGTSDAGALAEYLAAEGLPGVVTTNPFGALAWEESYTETLRGAAVVIAVVDNDAAGMKRAALLERELGPHVEELRILRSPLEHKGADLRDHLSAGLALGALVPAEPSEGNAEHAEAGATPEPYTQLDLGTFLASPPPEPDWDWHGWYARGDLVLVAGDPGVGKSLVALASAVIGARGGGELLGEALAARRTLYIDLESPEDVVYVRLYGFGLRGAADGFAYVHRPGYFNLLDAECLARLRATIAAVGAELVVIDSLRRAAPGLDENDSRDVGTMLTALREIAAGLRATILLIHHPRKPAGDAKVDALYAARGSGDLIGSADSYLFYRKLDGGLVRIEHGKARRGREHEPVSYRVAEGAAGEPVIEYVDVPAGPEDGELFEAVLVYVREHPGEPQTAIEDAVHGGRKRVRAALERGASANLVARGPGRARNGKYWYPAGHEALRSPGEHEATSGGQLPLAAEGGVVAPLAAPPKGAGEQTGDHPAGPAAPPAEEGIPF